MIPKIEPVDISRNGYFEASRMSRFPELIQRDGSTPSGWCIVYITQISPIEDPYTIQTTIDFILLNLSRDAAERCAVVLRNVFEIGQQIGINTGQDLSPDSMRGSEAYYDDVFDGLGKLETTRRILFGPPRYQNLQYGEPVAPVVHPNHAAVVDAPPLQTNAPAALGVNTGRWTLAPGQIFHVPTAAVNLDVDETDRVDVADEDEDWDADFDDPE